MFCATMRRSVDPAARIFDKLLALDRQARLPGVAGRELRVAGALKVTAWRGANVSQRDLQRRARSLSHGENRSSGIT